MARIPLTVGVAVVSGNATMSHISSSCESSGARVPPARA
jgi:hypothetical protein